MADPFIGEIRSWAFNYAPESYAFCDGTLYPVMQNQALFSLLGVQFGGDGRSTFGLPDLKGRVALGTTSPGYQQGLQYIGGSERITLTSSQIPGHGHSLTCVTGAGNKGGPTDRLYAKITPVSPATSPVNIYGSPNSVLALHSSTLSALEGDATHENMQPFLVINYCIALYGYYPVRP